MHVMMLELAWRSPNSGETSFRIPCIFECFGGNLYFLSSGCPNGPTICKASHLNAELRYVTNAPSLARTADFLNSTQHDGLVADFDQAVKRNPTSLPGCARQGKRAECQYHFPNRSLQPRNLVANAYAPKLHLASVQHTIDLCLQ